MKAAVLCCVLVYLYLFTDTVSLHQIPANFSIVKNLNSNRYRRQLVDKQFTCTLPPHPANGRWIILNGEGTPGEKITINSILSFHCKKGYKLSSKSQYVVCDKRWNLLKVPECLKLCPPINSTSTTIVKCVDKSNNDIACNEATEDSYLSYTCAPFYEAPFGYKTTFRCSEGDWSSSKPICHPICGRKIDARPLIYGGKIETFIEYPWIVALYNRKNDDYENICGGSIISQRLVLTAAHCVTNEYGDPLPAENYVVAAGKLYNKYNDSNDPKPQYLEGMPLEQVLLAFVKSKLTAIKRTCTENVTFKGSNRRYLADIAVLVTKQSFVFNDLVQPVCFNDVKNVNLQVGTMGVVGGWGVTETGEPSDQLRTLEIPYKSEATCAKELPGDWGDRFNVIDKLCAGLVNQSMSICRGDSGGGLYFKNTENNRYYVHGVVSLGHSIKGQCNIQQNSLYTKVAFHYDFVDRLLTRYYISDCTLPPHPDNGKWVIRNKDKNPGDIVPSDTILIISCEEGYKLSSDKTRIKCESSFIMPKCQRLCPVLKLDPGINFECKTKEGDVIPCADATDFTTLSFKCPDHYKVSDGSKTTRQCKNGAWELPIPACQLAETIASKVTPSIKVICIYDNSKMANGVKPEDLNATLCTHVIYNSVSLMHDGNIRVPRNVNGSEGNKTIYERIVDMKKRNRKLKVLVTVHGAGIKNTDEFPMVAADVTKTTTLITSIINFLETYHFDGVNLHWETPTEKTPFSSLIKELKEALKPRGWIFIATVYYSPTYLGYDVIELNRNLDWINVECYDLYGEWTRYTGQNSALFASPLESEYQQEQLNINECGHNWNLFGMPNNKIALSAAFFGRYYTLQNESYHGIHAPVTASTASSDTGRVTYVEICQNYTNWTRVWDNDQKTPYKYYKNKWLGYDDRRSVKLKAAFIKEKGYVGVTAHPVNGDDVYGKCGPKQILLKQVHVGLNTKTPS